MRMPSTIAGLLIFVAATSNAADAADYKIALSRPSHVGDRYRTYSTYSESETVALSKDGNNFGDRKKSRQATLQGIVEVLKVDKVNDAVKLRVTVEKLVDGDGETLLKKGQVIIAETVDGKRTYRLTEGKLSTETRKHLEELVRTKTSDKVSDDDAFGTDQRQKVGDSWKLKPKPFAKLSKIKPESVSGGAKLEAVEQHQGLECLRISMNARLKEFPNAQALEKQGFEIDSVKFVIKGDGLFPTDHKQQRLTSKLSLSVDAVAKGVKGAAAGVVMKLTVRKSSERKRMKLK